MIDVDVKALVIFKSVYETGCCGETSRQFRISNSKVTRYLSSLREYYQDSLFIRKKEGFIPTARAKAIYPKICEISELLSDISVTEICLTPKKECTIAVPPTLSVGLPEFIDCELESCSLSASTHIKHVRPQTCEEMLQGGMCLAVIQDDDHGTQEALKRYKSTLMATPIGTGQFVYIVAREEHPVWFSGLSLVDIAHYPFVVTAIEGFNDIRDPLEAYCEQNQLALGSVYKTHSLAGLITKLRSSDAISFLGTHCAADFVGVIHGLKAVRMCAEQYELLHSVIGKPSYSLLSRCDHACNCPEGFVGGIKAYILEQITD
ncbi:LysR family transcriptional regulator [uncultured Shewanella sp.]|uniref:LysR family transcriptional regulator n=1 Tax=uncultured Shewanella sp. TaxID=173975 RepID=UPI00262D9E5D|nr:LysR family transcriptional regulator [uncultured Shewanella sp.]